MRKYFLVIFTRRSLDKQSQLSTLLSAAIMSTTVVGRQIYLKCDVIGTFLEVSVRKPSRKDFIIMLYEI